MNNAIRAKFIYSLVSERETREKENEHILASTIVAFINIALNLALIVFCSLALYVWFQNRRPAPAPHAGAEQSVTG